MTKWILYIVTLWLVAFTFLPEGYFFENLKHSFCWEPAKIYHHDDYDDTVRLSFIQPTSHPQLSTPNFQLSSFPTFQLSSHPDPYFKVFANPSGSYPSEEDQIKYYQSQSQEHLALIPTSVKYKQPEKIETLPFARYATEDHLGRRSHVHSAIHFDKDTSRLPILSLIVEEDDFFSEDKGIYVRGMKSWERQDKWQKPWWEWPANYKQRGMEWERAASFLLLNKNGEMIWDELVGLRIHGNATRAYPQKSIRITFRDSYGTDEVKNKKHLSGGWTKKISAFIVRNGGNDWDFTLCRDVLQHEIALDLGLVAQDHHSVRMYLNGVYWGIHNLRPRVNKTFLAEFLDIKKSQVSLCKEGKAKYDCKDEPVDHFFEALEREDPWNNIDQSSVFNYLALEIFAANTDWPENNVMWTVNKERMWIPIVKDMDYGLGYPGPDQVKKNMFEILSQSNAEIAQLYQEIVAHEKTKNPFIAHFQQLLENELSEDNWLKHLNQLEKVLTPEMKHHTLRWRKFSFEEWQNNLEAIQTFISKRKKVLLDQLKEL